MTTDWFIAVLALGTLAALWMRDLYESMTALAVVGWSTLLGLLVMSGFSLFLKFRSKNARAERKRRAFIREIPLVLRSPGPDSVLMGTDLETGIQVRLPDLIRTRNTHIIGAPGSGKSESVILNFVEQDVARGLGTIILDAKGDASFLRTLNKLVPKEKLRVFDLGSRESLTYDPLHAGSAVEASQRLFSSLTWSEEYYKSKSFSALLRLFEAHRAAKGRNPNLSELDCYLDGPETFAAAVSSIRYSKKLAMRDFDDISGLRDQIRSLCLGHLTTTLSPSGDAAICLEEAHQGKVIYFRLQSLMSPQLVSILGKLVIQHLNYLAGISHRSETDGSPRKIVPVYLDEFASFACPEFADLISKARSAGFALHFSHQSIGDLAEVSTGFLNRITDSSATKVVLRVNDPDSAEFFARSFGTKLYQKVTQRVTNVSEADLAQTVGEGTQREAHQFRASPDLFKCLPTGVGSVLISHGYDTPHGASTVFKVQFPKLKEDRKP